MMKLTQGTVFFLDLRNFTLLCSKMITNPREDNVLESGLTQYETRLKYLVELTSGLYAEWHTYLKEKVDKKAIDHYLFQVLGDGAMVAFDGEQHAEAAFTAAVEIGKSMTARLKNEINPRIKELGINRYDDLLDFGIGIYSGEFTYVDVPKGSNDVSSRPGYTILGTAANYASRIENSNKDHHGTRITLAQTTVDCICKSRGIDTSDHREIEDSLGLRYAWMHKFRGIPEVGLYFVPLD